MNQDRNFFTSLRDYHQGLPLVVRVGGWLLLVALAVLLARCSGGNDQQKVEALRPVKLYQVGESSAQAVRHFIGRVDAISTVDLSFQVGGRIVELPVQQGTILPAGSLIAALDPADYRLALHEAELQLEQASRDLERAQSLSTRGSVSQASLDQTQTAHNLRRVALDTARRNLAYTRITAPFDALVARRLVDRFTNVQPNMQIVRVQNVEEFRVHINVPENLMGTVEHPETIIAEAIFHSYPDQPVVLTYREHETEPDAVAQTYRVTFGMPRNEAMNVLPGMTVTVRVRAATPTEVTFFGVPPSALDTDEQSEFRVWVYHVDSGSVSPRAVQMLGINEEGEALVLGLNGDEQIVSAGLHLMHDGMRVQPFESF